MKKNRTDSRDKEAAKERRITPGSSEEYAIPTKQKNTRRKGGAKS